MATTSKSAKRPAKSSGAAAKTQQADDLYRILAEKSFGGVYVVQSGIFKYLNTHAASYAGYTPEELTGKQAPSIVHPEDKEIQRKHAAEMLQGKRSSPHKFRIINRKGETRWIMETVTPISYQGRPAVLGNSMDITEHREAEELYRMLSEKSFGGVYVVQDGIFKYLNGNAASYAGYTPEELTGRQAPSIVHPEDKEIQRKRAAEMLQGKRSCPHEFRIINRKGETRWIMETVTPISYKGRPAVLGNSMDITSFKEVTTRMEEQKELVSSIVDTIPEAVIVVKNGEIQFASNAVEKIFKWQPAELVGKHVRSLYRNENDFKEVDKFIHYQLQSQRSCNQEVYCRRKDDSAIICCQHTALVGENLKYGKLVLIYKDITERKRSEELIKDSERMYQELSIKDSLTKLYNNRHFHELLKSEIARTNRYNHPLTLLMMDIDNFKKYNDTYGHVEGDAVLSRFAEVVLRHIRETDRACRYGGEEFVIILPETVGDNGVIIAERIRHKFKKEVFSPKENAAEHITVSIGVAQYIKEEDIHEFIKRADKRMYKAKQKGKDQVCY
jgi:diguanylate cyclase (GGDEF)-like protein/PAS domain S-box-containing protein